MNYLPKCKRKIISDDFGCKFEKFQRNGLIIFGFEVFCGFYKVNELGEIGDLNFR